MVELNRRFSCSWGALTVSLLLVLAIVLEGCGKESPAEAMIVTTTVTTTETNTTTSTTETTTTTTTTTSSFTSTTSTSTTRTVTSTTTTRTSTTTTRTNTTTSTTTSTTSTSTTTTTATSTTTTTTTRTSTTTSTTTITSTTTTTTTTTRTTTTTTTTSRTITSTTSTTTIRFGSFLVIGDWGWDPDIHGETKNGGCQKAIADAMDSKSKLLADVKFVINVGDSFYPGGVKSKSDPQWDTKWRNIYSKQLRSVPWYTVYGNHDLHKDPCACSSNLAECAQVNADVHNLNHFYMPNTSYTVNHPDLHVEVIALDMNYYPAASFTCGLTPCPAACERNLKTRMDAAFELFNTRMA